MSDKDKMWGIIAGNKSSIKVKAKIREKSSEDRKKKLI